jgi:hypothetical protein
MSEHNAKMAALLAADAPAAHDLAFEVAVLARIEARRYRRGVILNIALAAAATALLALVMPPLLAAAQLAFGGISDWILAAALLGLSLPLQGWIVRRA